MSKKAFFTNPEFCSCTVLKHPGVLVAMIFFFSLLKRLLWNWKNHLETATCAQKSLLVVLLSHQLLIQGKHLQKC